MAVFPEALVMRQWASLSSRLREPHAGWRFESGSRGTAGTLAAQFWIATSVVSLESRGSKEESIDGVADSLGLAGQPTAQGAGSRMILVSAEASMALHVSRSRRICESESL